MSPASQAAPSSEHLTEAELWSHSFYLLSTGAAVPDALYALPTVWLDRNARVPEGPNEADDAYDEWEGNAETLLTFAADCGRADVASHLLRAGVDVDRPARAGWTPLINASNRGHSEVVTLLVRAGAALDAVNNYGFSALHAACTHGHLVCAQELCVAGASRVLGPASAYQRARRRGHNKLLGWLERTTDHVSALHYVALLPPARVVALLRDGGEAELARRMPGGRTPVQLARVARAEAHAVYKRRSCDVVVDAALAIGAQRSCGRQLVSQLAGRHGEDVEQHWLSALQLLTIAAPPPLCHPNDVAGVKLAPAAPTAATSPAASPEKRPPPPGSPRQPPATATGGIVSSRPPREPPAAATLGEGKGAWALALLALVLARVVAQLVVSGDRAVGGFVACVGALFATATAPLVAVSLSQAHRKPRRNPGARRRRPPPAA